MTQQLSLPFDGFAAEGVQTCKEALIQETTPINANRLSIAHHALHSLNASFDKYGHYPSPQMWAALTKIIQKMEEMAEGSLPSKVYVSSLDPGVGKTQAIIHFVQVLLQSTRRDAGVLICVSRLSEIESFIKELGLDKEVVAVLSSKDDINALGGNKATAPVLITTQQMVEQRCKYSSFTGAKDFHYKGKVRKVRIWDEAILPGETLTLNRDEIAMLYQPLRCVSAKLVERLEQLHTELKDVPDGGVITLPALEEDYGINRNDIHRLLDNANDKQKGIADGLWHVSGRMVTVRRDGKYGNTMLDFKETLPDDIKPVLVLDASARVRGTYPLWEANRGDLEVLPEATKDYSNLNVHVWQRGGGKSAFRKNPHDLIEGVVNTIKTKPNEDWLVVHHQNGIGMDFEDEVLTRLKGSAPKVNFIHWGNHHGTNAYKDVPNVILAGTLFYRPSHYESLGRLSAGRKASDGGFTAAEHKEIRKGEHSHLILQALCRGSVRKCINGQCAPCDAYIIASVGSGIPAALPTIFPGCNTSPWKPIQITLRGKVAKAHKYITQRLSESPEDHIPFKDVQLAISETDRSNFRRTIRQHSDFVELLAQDGIVEHGKASRVTGFAMNYEVHFGSLVAA